MTEKIILKKTVRSTKPTYKPKKLKETNEKLLKTEKEHFNEVDELVMRANEVWVNKEKPKK